MPVGEPLGAAAAALGRANGPWEGVRVGYRGRGGGGRWALCRPRSPGGGDRWLATSLGGCGYKVCREADPRRRQRREDETT